jgi:sugar phosphate isomerase/epimerase
MSRPVTLFTGQWADLPLETLVQKAGAWGFDGLELACWGDHFEVDKALESDGYVRKKRDLLEKHKLQCHAISSHLVGQCVCDDPIDNRHKSILPAGIWGDGDPEGVRRRAAVNGFTGSSIWPKLYFFPPTAQADVDRGYADFATRWLPILDAFKKQGVRFALEVHPTEIAYDILTARRALDAVNGHPQFGFNFDPSHFIHQFVNPVMFIEAFPDRIFHVHVKDSRVQLTGANSILSSHLDFGDPRRGWDFVSPGRGDVKWDPIVRALNRAGYKGPLSIEWEDTNMNREYGAKEALDMIRRQDFEPSDVAFDAAFSKK